MLKKILFLTVWSKYPLFFLFIACNSSPQKVLSEEEKVLQKTCAYLWQQQQEDGGWHSEIHGLLKKGQAYTPFILSALLEVPDSIYPKSQEKIEKALDFIRSHIQKSGVSGLSDIQILEYPNYTTAYSLMVLSKYGKDSDKALIQKMINYLINQQFDEDRGLSPENPAYGGWGFGETRLPKGEAGHIDISHTRRILQALKAAGHTNKSTYQKAEKFLLFLQKHPSDKRNQPDIGKDSTKKIFYDGGFYYSPVVRAANKAKQEITLEDYQAFYRSYATTTCDGLLALLAIGKNPQDQALQKAKEWLLKNPSLEKAQGIPEEDIDQWHQVLVYYHWAVRAEAYKVLKYKGDNWQKKLFALIKKEQKPDGSFSNPAGARNKEDDPLLASAFVVISLENSLN